MLTAFLHRPLPFLRAAFQRAGVLLTARPAPLRAWPPAQPQSPADPRHRLRHRGPPLAAGPPGTRSSAAAARLPPPGGDAALRQFAAWSLEAAARPRPLSSAALQLSEPQGQCVRSWCLPSYGL
eukprot:TRINITY_DN10170_c0_g1_i1.p1 TRINITY_DN10170_c0_g1~~TRINITY_DN10170_c0_g1_i1.p1  ORF type:complete len:124 (+),score=10.21 TRINITY_DN10170_c0_g1_i1:827-1198(+)